MKHNPITIRSIRIVKLRIAVLLQKINLMCYQKTFLTYSLCLKSDIRCCGLPKKKKIKTSVQFCVKYKLNWLVTKITTYPYSNQQFCVLHIYEKKNHTSKMLVLTSRINHKETFDIGWFFHKKLKIRIVQIYHLSSNFITSLIKLSLFLVMCQK